jgi:hypothetical protein
MDKYDNKDDKIEELIYNTEITDTILNIFMTNSL